LGQDKASVEIKAGMKPNEFAIVCGYGRVGKMVCDMLDRKLVRYLAFDYSPQKAVEARQKGLPVFFGE
jgi:S-adenosylhomocysteine hydrolase